MGWRGWRAGTGRPRATIRFRWRSIRCWCWKSSERWRPKPTPRQRLYALLHDAPEYVMGDIISPFKAAMGGNYKEVENRLMGAIYLHFALNATPPVALARQIKRADREVGVPRSGASGRLRGRGSAEILRRADAGRIRPRAVRGIDPAMADAAKRMTVSSTPSICWRRPSTEHREVNVNDCSILTRLRRVWLMQG